MVNVLKAVGFTITPEVYSAYAVTKAGAILLGVFPCLVLLTLLLPLLLIILAVLTYFKEIRKANEKLRAKRDQIEGELPRFVVTIKQTIKSNRDVARRRE